MGTNTINVRSGNKLPIPDVPKDMFERLFSRPIYPALIVAAAAFVVYLQTLAPSVDFIDAGELATVCATLGIAHPTGYPLFALVGWVFAHLPIASTVILRLNIMAAFFTALGAGGVVLLATELFQHWMPVRVPKKTGPKVEGRGQRAKGREQRGKDRTQSVYRKHGGEANARKGEATAVVSTLPSTLYPVSAAFVSGLAAAFSATWWEQSTSIEVYPMHLFFVPLVLWFFLRMLRLEEGSAVGNNGRRFALLLALAFTNHMTTILLAPACLYMFFARYRFSNVAWKRILHLAPFFILGLLVYLYLPIRSSQYPLMDWGHPTTLGAFLRHVTAKQFQIWMYTGTGAAGKQWAYFWSRVPIEFTIAGAILAVLGVWKMYMSGGMLRTHILVFTLLLFFGCLLYSINYDIHDIDSYFLLAYLAVALWIGAGSIQLVSWLGTSLTKGWRMEYVLAALALLLAAIEIGANYKADDESGNYMVEDYTLNLLRNLPPHAIIFSTQWDFWLSSAFYFQLVEHVRPDVLVIDKAMLRDRPWYYAELGQRAPEVFAKVKPEEDAFLKYLKAFVRGDQFNQEAIGPAYQRFTSALVERNLDRPIFITQEMVDQRDDLFAPGMKTVPAGIAYRLVPKDTTFNVPPPQLTWRDAHYRDRNYYTDELRTLEALPMATYAREELRLGNRELAKQYFDAALTFTPNLYANLDHLSERDRGIAETTNELFGQIKELRASLGK